MRKVTLATGNLHKVKEVAQILSEYSIEVEHVDAKVIEIQSETLEEVAKTSVVMAAEKIRGSVIVEDSGLFIESLKGFPGVYSYYIQKTIGNKGVLKLMEGVENRGAIFKSVVAYCQPGQNALTFTGEVHGKIANQERGLIWGFDPIFIPEDGGGRTFAEMGSAEKNKISHRRKALEKFANWFRQGLQNRVT